MKKTLFLFLYLVTFVKIYGQDFVYNDTIIVAKTKYDVMHISYGKTSLTKYFKVITCDAKLKNTIVKEIKRCYSNGKYEYSEIYLVFIPNLSSLSIKTENKIILTYLEKIDQKRMKSNLSTALIKFKYDYKSNSYTYLLGEPKSNLGSLNIVCNRITKPKIQTCLRK